MARVVTSLLPDTEREASSRTSAFLVALRLETFGAGFWGPLYYGELAPSH